MSETLYEKLTKTKEGMRLYQQERAIQDLTDLICEIMSERGISRSELAKRVGVTKDYITQFLDGSVTMDLRFISDIFTTLGQKVLFDKEKL